MAVEEAPHEGDERDALELHRPLLRLLAPQQRLEAVGVGEGVGGERRHHLTEADVAIGKGGPVPLRAQEDRADGGSSPAHRYDDDRLHVARGQRDVRAAEEGIGHRVGDEHRLSRLERALQLRVAREVHDQVADVGILVRGDHPDVVRVAGEKHRAAIQAEGVAELAGDRLRDLAEMRGGGDGLEDVHHRHEVVALALELFDARAEPGELVRVRLFSGRPGRSLGRPPVPRVPPVRRRRHPGP